MELTPEEEEKKTGNFASCDARKDTVFRHFIRVILYYQRMRAYKAGQIPRSETQDT
jgi:hypothetical protein